METNARSLVEELARRHKSGRRVKKQAGLKKKIMEALSFDEWPGFGPVKVMVGLSDYCSPAEAGVAFHRTGADAEAFHYQQMLGGR